METSAFVLNKEISQFFRRDIDLLTFDEYLFRTDFNLSYSLGSLNLVPKACACIIVEVRLTSYRVIIDIRRNVKIRFIAKRITRLLCPIMPKKSLGSSTEVSDTPGRRTSSRSQAIFLPKH